MNISNRPTSTALVRQSIDRPGVPRPPSVLPTFSINLNSIALGEVPSSSRKEGARQSMFGQNSGIKSTPRQSVQSYNQSEMQ